jgi:hypothetical protein
VSGERPSDLIRGLPAPLSELPWSADFVMQAIEVLTVVLDRGRLEVLRPDCADSFIVGWPAGEKPEQVASAALRTLGLEPLVLHSTSWRHSGSEVVLTYLAVIDAGATLPPSWEAQPIAHVELARGDATAPPPVIGVDQVLEHALRHLTWLVHEDATIGATLPGWTEVLAGYVPEPFRAFGVPSA